MGGTSSTHVVNHVKIIKDEYELKKTEGVSEDDLIKHMIHFIKKTPIKKCKKNRVRKILEDSPITLKVTCEGKDETKVFTFNKSHSIGKLKELAATSFEIPMNYSVFHDNTYLKYHNFKKLSDNDSIHLARHEKLKIYQEKKQSSS